MLRISFNVIEIKVEVQVKRIAFPLGSNLNLSLLSANRHGADTSAPCREFGGIHQDELYVYFSRSVMPSVFNDFARPRVAQVAGT
ncbi:MAG: hypothetical protein U0223_06585 [Nitrospira sp.]|nr:hypothetical protein [Nitrospira sp.]